MAKALQSWLHSIEKSLEEEKADRIVHLTCCFSWVHWCLKISVQAGGQRSSRSSVGPCRHWGMRPGPVLIPLPTCLKLWLNSQTQQGIVRQCVQFCHSGSLIQKDYHSLSQLTMVCCYVFLDPCFNLCFSVYYSAFRLNFSQTFRVNSGIFFMSNEPTKFILHNAKWLFPTMDISCLFRIYCDFIYNIQWYWLIPSRRLCN